MTNTKCISHINIKQPPTLREREQYVAISKCVLLTDLYDRALPSDNRKEQF